MTVFLFRPTPASFMVSIGSLRPDRARSVGRIAAT
jgi:hypothetical protein